MALALPQSVTRCCHSCALPGARGDSLALVRATAPALSSMIQSSPKHLEIGEGPRRTGSGPLWVQMFPVSVQISPGGCRPPVWVQILLPECRHPVSMQNPLCGILLCGVPPLWLQTPPLSEHLSPYECKDPQEWGSCSCPSRGMVSAVTPLLAPWGAGGCRLWGGL